MNLTLDYNAAKGTFILYVPRGVADPRTLMLEHGLDYSISASTGDRAVLFTREPYCAVAFHEYATPAAQAELLSLHVEIASSWQKESKGHIKVPADEQLAPFQIAGVEYALRRNNTLFGDVPGLGKSPEAMAVCNEVNAKRVLIICPANIRLQWVKVIRRWTTMPWPYIIYPILHGRHGVHPTANFTIVSYDLARTAAIGKALAKGTYDVMIIDELHYAKEVSAARTRAIFGGGAEPKFEALANRCGMILGLTGTPLPNRPREAYTAARGLCWDSIDFMSEDKFRERFNPSMMIEREDKETGKIKRIVDERSGRHGELQSRLRANFMVRREKHGPDGVGYQLGMLNLPSYSIIHVEETGAVKAAQKAESLLDIDPEDLDGADIAALGSIATVRRMMGIAIAPLAAEYVEMCLNGGEEKLVVFAHHIQVLDILEKQLQSWGCVRIDGSLSSHQKQARVDDFVADPKKHIILGNMQSMGTGTDGLQAVSYHAIFAEADWVAGVNQQAVDRLDRGGQQEIVQADFLVAPNSFSERVLAGALRKNQTTNKALDRRM